MNNTEAPDLNSKFNSLIKKIELSKKQNADDDKDLQDENKGEDEYNKDKALKTLYDESVGFKNTLADLRTKIKHMNGLFNDYDLKCNELIGREFDEYKSLKTKLEEEK